ADYRPANPVKGKVRRKEERMDLELTPNPDVLAALVLAAPGAKVLAFAAEPDPGLETAAQKAERKNVFAIAVNDISRADVGFESEENELTLVYRDGRIEHSGKQSKLGCALWLLETLART
ncbi:MAG: phosphopantothenoylcysteine decarboxylase, partial [Fimbriimonas sp.]